MTARACSGLSYIRYMSNSCVSSKVQEENSTKSQIYAWMMGDVLSK